MSSYIVIPGDYSHFSSVATEFKCYVFNGSIKYGGEFQKRTKIEYTNYRKESEQKRKQNTV